MSCIKKRNLYLACRHNTNEAAKQHYRLYCKILAQVITDAKSMYYNKKIQKSDNKYKATRGIIKEITGRQQQQKN